MSGERWCAHCPVKGAHKLSCPATKGQVTVSVAAGVPEWASFATAEAVLRTIQPVADVIGEPEHVFATKVAHRPTCRTAALWTSGRKSLRWDYIDGESIWLASRDGGTPQELATVGDVLAWWGAS